MSYGDEPGENITRTRSAKGILSSIGSIPGWAIVLGSVVALYLIIYLALPHLFSGSVNAYIVTPILWCVLIALTLLASKYKPEGRLRFTRSLIWISLLVGAFQVAMLVIAGLLLGFGYSPYLFTTKAIFMNLAIVASALVGMEFSRAYLVNVFSKRYTTLTIALVTLLYTAISIPLFQFSGIGGGMQSLTFFGATLLPLLALNLLASYLVFHGGPLASIAYCGVIGVFWWFCPILPDLSWMMTAFVGVIAPVIGFLVVAGLIEKEEEKPSEAQGEAKKKGASLYGWIAVAIVIVVIIFGAFGFFGFHLAVVGGHSMEPTLKLGDIAVITEADIDSIKVGHIIQYREGNMTVLHRVIEIEHQGGSKVFITKGDAIDTTDTNPVHPEQIMGKVKFVVPKLGWVSIWIKNLVGQVA